MLNAKQKFNLHTVYHGISVPLPAFTDSQPKTLQMRSTPCYASLLVHTNHTTNQYVWIESITIIMTTFHAHTGAHTGTCVHTYTQKY